MDPNAAVCVKCGVPAGTGVNFCPNCGEPSDPNAAVCVKCGVAFVQPQAGKSAKSKLAAGLLGIFLGSIGVHRFYLGYTLIGVLQIIVTLVTCGAGALWGFIEGILILCGKGITTDANGAPLGD
jgi:TM2 domain-containing membrane protein YozV